MPVAMSAWVLTPPCNRSLRVDLAFTTTPAGRKPRAIASGDPTLRGAQRARLEAATDYLDAAPRVVAVARDVAVPEVDMSLPTAVADPALMSRLAVDHGLTSSFDRVLNAARIG